MKNVQNILILALFILGSFSVVAQNPERTRIILENQAKGNAILQQFNIAVPCITYTETPEGIYIGVRDALNKPTYFHYENGVISETTLFYNHVIHGYSSLTNELIVSSCNKSALDDYLSSNIKAYSFKTKKFRTLVSVKGSIIHVDVKTDTFSATYKVKGGKNNIAIERKLR